MKSFWLDDILKPGAAIAFCLVFGLPFVYTGFQGVEVNGTKDDQGEVTIDFTHKHFGGFYRVVEQNEGIENATLKSSLVRRTVIRNTRKSLVSGVFIETGTEALRLIAGSSNMNDPLELDAVRGINGFIEDAGQTQYVKTIRLSNIFSWVGLPFLVIGVWDLIGWPSSIIKHIRD